MLQVFKSDVNQTIRLEIGKLVTWSDINISDFRFGKIDGLGRRHRTREAVVMGWGWGLAQALGME